MNLDRRSAYITPQGKSFMAREQEKTLREQLARDELSPTITIRDGYGFMDLYLTEIDGMKVYMPSDEDSRRLQERYMQLLRDPDV